MKILSIFIQKYIDSPFPRYSFDNDPNYPEPETIGKFNYFIFFTA